MRESGRKNLKVAAAIFGLIALLVASPSLAMWLKRLTMAQDFDREVWLASDGQELESPRGYMLGDVEDLLDKHPTRDEVIQMLGPADAGGHQSGEASYYVGFQHSLMPMDVYTLDLEFENDRVVGYRLVQH